jgi:hypothetical protein
MDLNWDFHCTMCNAVAGSHRHLADATAVDRCPLCDVEFRNTLDANVEVTFTPVEKLYQISRRFLAEQAKQTVEIHGAGTIEMPPIFVSGLDCMHVPLFRKIFESETLSLRESLQIKQLCIMFTDSAPLGAPQPHTTSGPAEGHRRTSGRVSAEREVTRRQSAD